MCWIAACHITSTLFVAAGVDTVDGGWVDAGVVPLVRRGVDVALLVRERTCDGSNGGDLLASGGASDVGEKGPVCDMVSVMDGEDMVAGVSMVAYRSSKGYGRLA